MSRNHEGALSTVRVSRRVRQCEFYICRRHIVPGERYTRYAMPPNGEMGNESWWVVDLCSDCHPIAEQNYAFVHPGGESR